jgi:hypothetical protein
MEAVSVGSGERAARSGKSARSVELALLLLREMSRLRGRGWEEALCGDRGREAGVLFEGAFWCYISIQVG